MAQSYKIELDNGGLITFSRDHLYLSIYDSLSHRNDAIESAAVLTETILAALLRQKRLRIPRRQIIDTSKEIIKRFDRTAYVRYVSLHN